MNEPNQDANEASASSTDEATGAATQDAVDLGADTTQGVENTSSESKSSDKTPFHEHPRFQELINSNRELKYQIEALKNQQMQSRSQETPQKSAITRAIERYVAKGVDPQVARELVEDQVAIANEAVAVRTGPLVENTQGLVLKNAFDSFKATHKDYEQVHLDMLEIMNSLPPVMRQALALNPSEGLDLVYAKVVADKALKLQHEAIQKGKDEAYSKKKEKSAQSSSSTSSPELDPVEKELAEMSLEEYMKPENQVKYEKMAQRELDKIKRR